MVVIMLLSFLIFLKYNVQEGMVVPHQPSFLLVICQLLPAIHTLVESITIIKNFGVQLRVRYLFGNEKVEFFDNDRINNVFVHEYFYGSQVRYSLAFIIKGQERMSLLFKHVYPGFDKMKRVYGACKHIGR